MSIQTLSELFLMVAERDQPDCLLHKVDGRYVSVGSTELARRVRCLAQALEELGVARGDRVGLMAENGPHWPTVDFATLCVGAALVPIYPTLPPEPAAFVAHDSGAQVIFVQGRERLAGLLGQRSQMPQARHFVLIEEGPPGESAPPDVRTLSALCDSVGDVDPDRFKEQARRSRPEDLATLIYTSGTTGKPKGVMLSHGNIVSNVLACAETLDLEADYTALSFLPLSHSFERTIDYIYFYHGCAIAYAESIHTLGENFKEVNPHMFVSVPRVYEKVIGRVNERVSKASSLRQKIFHWALAVGKQAVAYRLRDELPPGLLGFKLRLADRLVFAEIRSALGDRFQYATSGGGPLGREAAEFLWAAGIQVFEGYGLTETAPVLTSNRPGAIKLGTVGRALPGVELRIAEDGEVLARGPNVMQGYFNRPEDTAECLGGDGWLRTGDIGEVDDDGYLTITDRKKEILVNAYGKNIAPAPIENDLRSSRFIDQAVVIGDRRPYLSALIVPDFEVLDSWARTRGIPSDDRERLLKTPQVIELYEGEVQSINRNHSPYEEIRTWELLSQEFTLETGELTPTQKVKRRVIDDKYEATIARLYDDARRTSQATVS